MSAEEANAAEWERVAGMVFGFFPAQVVQTVARLGVPDALGTGSLDLDALATRTGSQPDALARLHENYLTCGVRERDDTAYRQRFEPDYEKRRPRW